MDRNMMIDILMQDYCTKKEAENFIKRNRVIIYDNPDEYIQILKENDVFNGETIEDIRQRKYPDVSIVKYNDQDYLIEYIN